MEDGSNRVVDLETGDFYVWDDVSQNYVKEEPVVMEEVSVVNESVIPSVENNVELPVQSDSVHALEEKVDSLQGDVQSLSLEVAALNSAVSEYNLGTSNLSIFSGITEKVPFGKHYVYWRDSEYRYCLAVGSLTVSGTTFSSVEPVTVYTYERHYISGDSYYSWSVRTDDVFSLSCEDRLVYSDIGDYPTIAGKEVTKYDAVTAYCAIGVVLFALFDRLRNSCLR